MGDDFTLSKYMEILLRSRFPQFSLLSAKEFLANLKRRGIHRTLRDLEFYDKIQVVKPVLRVHGTCDSTFKRCPKTLTMSSLKYYLDKQLVDLPSNGDYKPWKEWIDVNGDPLYMYYHRAQIVGFESITNDVRLNLDPQGFLEIFEPGEYVSGIKKHYSKTLQSCEKRVKDHWLPRIGFLMLLEESYSPDATHTYFGDRNPETTIQKWQEWKSSEFSTKSVIENSALNAEDIFALYCLLAGINRDDPLRHWYPLLSIMKKSRKRQLAGKALVSQDYYDFATMVRYFIEDEYDQNVSPPDDLGDRHWHERLFGTPFDYDSSKTQRAILDYYMFYPPKKVAILYEGTTEDYVIKRILEALQIYIPKSGLTLHSAGGADNLQSNFDSFFELAKQENIDGFVIVDQDRKAVVDALVRKCSVKKDMTVVWNNDFEFDNFGVEKVVKVVNDILKDKSQKTITISEINSKLDKNSMLMNAVSNEVRKQTGDKLDSFISKTKIAERIFEPRASEIDNEYQTNGWVPNLPIEKKLQELFSKYPSYL